MRRRHLPISYRTSMDTLSQILCVIVLFAVTVNTKGTVCKSNSDCGSGECCYIKPEFEVVSRRRQANILPLQPVHHDTGVCESYKLEHTPCWPLETANGHCGCTSGMSCQFVPANKTQTLLASKKRKIYFPGPGAYQCEMSS